MLLAAGNFSANVIDKYDPETNVWTRLKTTGTFTSRFGLTASVVNNKIYIIGGVMDFKALFARLFKYSIL